MGATLLNPPTLPFLGRNLSILSQSDPALARTLHANSLPADLTDTPGRDASSTFSWTDGDGTTRWLGRSTMPAVRATALIDAFNPGTGNVLFFGMGQGSEVRRLLDRLASRQALFVLESDPVQMKLCLALHDFASDLTHGRLVLLGGSDPWTGLDQFLRHNPGYLSPDRILSWPWFSHGDVHDISNRLTQICQSIAGIRSEQRQSLAFPPRDPDDALAILELTGSDASQACAAGLCGAATSAGLGARSFDNHWPRLLHPLAIELELVRHPPSHIILIDADESSTPLRLPPSRKAVILTHRNPLKPQWLEHLDRNVVLCIRTREQCAEARRSGRGAESVLHLPPAASNHLCADPDCRARRIAIAADCIDTSAAAAGLHLGSHCSIYEAVEKIAAQKCDAASAGQVQGFLKSALSTLGIALQSDDVRRGIEQRIEQILLPGVISREFIKALDVAEIDFALTGHGWNDRQHVPNAADLTLDAGTGLLICLDPVRLGANVILNAIISGLPMALRCANHAELDFLEGTLDINTHVVTFATRRAMTEIIRRFDDDPTEYRRRAALAQKHILDSHTWSHRLESLLNACRRG